METIVGHLPNGTTGPAPVLRCYKPRGRHARIGLIIFPGGGYGGLADHEGAEYADHFTRHGIACFVTRYRLGSAGFRHPAMVEDALAAIHAVREAAPALDLDPRAIGVMGSSAGGHLAAHALVAWRRHAGDVLARPDFGILCYPVILSRGPFHHRGSIENLLGSAPEPALLDEVSCDAQVTSDTPPCFLWHTAEDPAVPVENSLQFAAALRQHGVPFELHVYQQGGHGLGLRASFPWADECVRWLRDITNNHATASSVPI